MKRFTPLLILVCLLLLTPAHSQDVNSSDQELDVKLLSITTKYYKGGQRIKKKEFFNYLQVEDDLYYPFKMGKTVSDIGGVLFILSGTVAFLDVRYRSRLKALGQQSEDPLQKAYLSGACIGAGLGIAMHFFGHSVMKRKVAQYNQTQVTGLDFKANQEGVGLVFSF